MAQLNVQPYPMPVVGPDDVTSTGLHNVCAIASDLGIRCARGWPLEIPTSMGNGEPFVYNAHYTKAGELVEVMYLQRGNVLLLTLFND